MIGRDPRAVPPVPTTRSDTHVTFAPWSGLMTVTAPVEGLILIKEGARSQVTPNSEPAASKTIPDTTTSGSRGATVVPCPVEGSMVISRDGSSGTPFMESLGLTVTPNNVPEASKAMSSTWPTPQDPTPVGPTTVIVPVA